MAAMVNSPTNDPGLCVYPTQHKAITGVRPPIKLSHKLKLNPRHENRTDVGNKSDKIPGRSAN
jgi:hypothetical protein